MNFLLIRHATALPSGSGGISDDESRPLSDVGMAQCAPLARAIDRLGVRPGIVLSSPLLRARETAAGILNEWKGDVPELRVIEEMAPGYKKAKLAKALRSLNADTIALVGHQPDLSELAGWLIGSKRAQIEFEKAGVAFLSSSSIPAKGSATLNWMLTAEIAALLGRET